MAVPNGSFFYMVKIWGINLAKGMDPKAKKNWANWILMAQIWVVNEVRLSRLRLVQKNRLSWVCLGGLSLYSVLFKSTLNKYYKHAAKLCFIKISKISVIEDFQICVFFQNLLFRFQMIWQLQETRALQVEFSSSILTVAWRHTTICAWFTSSLMHSHIWLPSGELT